MTSLADRPLDSISSHSKKKKSNIPYFQWTFSLHCATTFSLHFYYNATPSARKDLYIDTYCFVFQELSDDSFTQTVGSVTAEPQSCQWCNKQYATKAKLIQHQRKAHLLLLPQSLRVPSNGSLSSKNAQVKNQCQINQVELTYNL